MTISILHRDDLTLGGFAGLKEHRLVVDQKMGGGSDTWDGIGNFVYMADAKFLPMGETHLHPHKEIDVISVMVHGNITHEGSLENGKGMGVNQAQVQRAGGEGFSHNEKNSDPTENRMIQIWVLPEKSGEAAGYKFYDLKVGEVNPIYGETTEEQDTFDSHTTVSVGLLNEGQEVTEKGEFMAYMTKGKATINGTEVKDGDLLRGTDLHFKAITDAECILIGTV